MIPEIFSAVNLAFYKKDNEQSAKEVKGLLGDSPDLTELATQHKDIIFRFVRGNGRSNGHGASAEIEKGYSSNKNFPSSTTPLAIKKMQWQKIDRENPEILYELIDREVYALMHLCYGEKVSPSLTRFFGSFYHPATDEHWLAFEFCAGGDLSFMKTLPVNFDQIAAIAAGALEGLAVLHKEGYIHADIKPDNLLLAEPGIIKLCDFGLTAKTKDVHEPDLHALGTPRYMSPEHMLRNVALDDGETAEDFVYDHKTDIWALGIVLLEILVGRAPVYQIRRVSKNMFNKYILNMTKNIPRYKGSGLKDLLIMRKGYTEQLTNANIEPHHDVEELIKRCPMLEPHIESIPCILSKPNLTKGTIDPSTPVPKVNKPGLYRLNVCLDFVAHCLICDYERRPNASALKNHQFVKAVSKELDTLLPQMKEIKVDYKTYSLKKEFNKKYPSQLTIKPLNQLIQHKKENEKKYITKHRYISKIDKS